MSSECTPPPSPHASLPYQPRSHLSSVTPDIIESASISNTPTNTMAGNTQVLQFNNPTYTPLSSPCSDAPNIPTELPPSVTSHGGEEAVAEAFSLDLGLSEISNKFENGNGSRGSTLKNSALHGASTVLARGTHSLNEQSSSLETFKQLVNQRH